MQPSLAPLACKVSVALPPKVNGTVDICTALSKALKTLTGARYQRLSNGCTYSTTVVTLRFNLLDTNEGAAVNILSNGVASLGKVVPCGSSISLAEGLNLPSANQAAQTFNAAQMKTQCPIGGL